MHYCVYVHSDSGPIDTYLVPDEPPHAEGEVRRTSGHAPLSPVTLPILAHLCPCRCRVSSRQEEGGVVLFPPASGDQLEGILSDAGNLGAAARASGQPAAKRAKHGATA